MGEGGQLKIVNASKYPLRLEHIHSYQMNAWDKEFPQIISPGKIAFIYIEWNDVPFGKDDDAGEARYNFVGTDFTFEIQARTDGGRHLQVYWKKIVHDPNFYSQPYPLEGVSKLGWLHDGIVPLTFCELAGGVTVEHSPTPNFDITDIPSLEELENLILSNNKNALPYFERWMELYSHLIGHLPLNKLTLVCTHNSGSYDMIECVKPYASCQDLDIYGQLRQGVRVLDIRVGYDSNESGDKRFILVHEMIKTNTTLKNAIEQVKRFLNENKNEVIILDFHRFTEFNSAKFVYGELQKVVKDYIVTSDNFDYDKLQKVVKDYIGTDLLYPYNKKIPTLNEIWDTSHRVIVAWNADDIRPDFFFPGIKQQWYDHKEKSGLYSKISDEMKNDHQNFGLWSICAILSQIPKPIHSLSPDVENWFQSGCDWALKSNIIALDFVEQTLIVQHAISECMLKGLTSIIQWPEYIYMKADNKKYLSRIYYTATDQNNCEPVKDDVDLYCEMKVISFPEENKIALQGDNGKYLSRISRGDIDNIEFAKDNIDICCKFEYTFVGTNKIALRADNGLYLSLINRDGKDEIEAAKKTIDQYSQFTVGSV